MANRVVRSDDVFFPYTVVSSNGVVIGKFAYEDDAALIASPRKNRLKELRREIERVEKLAPEFTVQAVKEWHAVEKGVTFYGQESTLSGSEEFVVLYREPKFPFHSPVRLVRP